MSTYGRITPYFLNSTLPDRSSNLLPTPDAEDFEVLGEIQEVVPVAATGASPSRTSIYFSGWTSGVTYGAVTDYVPFVVRIKNTGAQYFWAYWVPIDDAAANSAGSQFIAILPGTSVTLYARCAENQYNSAANPGQLVLQAPSGSGGSTAEVTAFQLDAATVIASLA